MGIAASMARADAREGARRRSSCVSSSNLNNLRIIVSSHEQHLEFDETAAELLTSRPLLGSASASAGQRPAGISAELIVPCQSQAAAQKAQKLQPIGRSRTQLRKPDRGPFSVAQNVSVPPGQAGLSRRTVENQAVASIPPADTSPLDSGWGVAESAGEAECSIKKHSRPAPAAMPHGASEKAYKVPEARAAEVGWSRANGGPGQESRSGTAHGAVTELVIWDVEHMVQELSTKSPLKGAVRSPVTKTPQKRRKSIHSRLRIDSEATPSTDENVDVATQGQLHGPVSSRSERSPYSANSAQKSAGSAQGDGRGLYFGAKSPGRRPLRALRAGEANSSPFSTQQSVFVP